MTATDKAIFLRLLQRAQAIVNSESDAAGRVRSIDRWPRAKRREFSRISAKIERIKARAAR